MLLQTISSKSTFNIVSRILSTAILLFLQLAILLPSASAQNFLGSTVKIDDNTTNGPVLANSDIYGGSVVSLGDLDGDGVADIVVGASGDDTSGSNRGAIYISYLNSDGSFKSTVKIDDSTTNGPELVDGDSYGGSVASLGDLDGDGVVDILVGASRDDTGGSDRGAVHILYLNSNGSVKSTIKIDDNTTNGPVLSNEDLYGVSVASLGDLDGDGVTDIAVGSSYDDTGGSDRGAVYISFLNSNGSVKSTVRIDDTTTNGPVLANSDLFGISLASLGDLDRDGLTDIAVGAYGDDTGGSLRGAVHILYLNSNGSVKSTVKIDDNTTNGPVLANIDFYGSSVSSFGDLDGDGVIEIAVGALLDNTGGNQRGAVHVSYLNMNGSIKSTVKIDDATTNGPVLSDFNEYGISVASLGDLNGDGVTDLAVGAHRDNTNGTERGALYIHFRPLVASTVKIDDSTTNGPVLGNDEFYGTSLASLGDLDGDGISDILVGAYLDNTGGIQRGAVYISYLNSNGSVKSTVKIASGTTNGPVLANVDFFGISVASLGDLDGDGLTDIAVGAIGDDTNGNQRGAVHILYLNSNGSIKGKVKIDDTTTNGPVLANDDRYGSSVTSLGDLDGDGITDIVVGANRDSTGGTNRGAVYISYLNSDGSVKSTVKIASGTTNGPVLANSNLYGSSLASLGDLDGDGVTDIAVGAYDDDTGGTNRGAVHISYLNSNGSVKNTVKIDDSTTNGPVLANDDVYGNSVASPGDLDGDGVTDILVGARGDDTGGAVRGALYISYLNSNGSIKSTAKIASGTTNGPVLANSDFYGYSVASLGDLDGDGAAEIAVGAVGDDTNGSSRGAVHLNELNLAGTREASVKGNGSIILDGDITPSLTDNSDFGSVNFGANTSRTYVISNSGSLALGLTGTPRVSITGTNSGDFSVTTQPALSVSAPFGTTAFIVQFAPSAEGLRNASISIANNDKNENPYNFSIQGTGLVPEMDVSGNSVSILDDDVTPSVSDATDFGTVSFGNTQTVTYTVRNTGGALLNLNGTPKVTLLGSSAFTVITQPSSPVSASGGTTTFVIQFSPTAIGLASTGVSIGNNDGDENPYNFAIQGTGLASEMDVSGNSVSIPDDDVTPSVSDATDFGTVNFGNTQTVTYTVRNTGGALLNLNGTPKVTLLGSSAFTVITQPSSPVSASGGTTTFVIQFTPTAIGLASTGVSIGNDDGDENPYNFAIQGIGNDPVDTDGDGTPNSIDPDDDNDGVSDSQELIDGTNPLDAGSALQTLSTTFCSEWNSFLGLLNVNEYANAASSNRNLDVTLSDINGALQSTTAASILANSQRDVLVHDLSGFVPNSYGRTCTEVKNGNPGDVYGLAMHYHPASSGTGFDFVVSLPYAAGRVGSQFAPFNTFHPSPLSTNFVANWVSVTNDSTTSGSGTMFYYAQDGSTLGSEAATLTAGARKDFSAHQFGPNRVGLVEWRANDQTTKYVVRINRYYYDNAEGRQSFNSAMNIEAVKPNGEAIVVPLDKRNGTAVLELSNGTNAAITVTATFRNSNGSVAGTTSYNLSARSTIHVVADGVLSTDIGSVSLDGSAVGSVIAVGTHYGRDSTSKLINSYALHSRQSLGSVLRSSYNTFIGQSCDLLLVNSTGTAVTSSITMTRYDGVVVANGVNVITPANGMTNYDLCANDSADNYGAVVVTPNAPNSIRGAVLRRGAADRYQFATEMRQ